MLGGNVCMYPQSTVDLARLLSDIGVLDRESAEICGVSIRSIRHWRHGDRRTIKSQGRASVPTCPRCHHRPLDESAYSDGCRLINRVRRQCIDGDRWHEYPRYFFVNHSAGILQLCGEALDMLSVGWRYSKPTAISVAQRNAVARLDNSSDRSIDYCKHIVRYGLGGLRGSRGSPSDANLPCRGRLGG